MRRSSTRGRRTEPSPSTEEGVAADSGVAWMRAWSPPWIEIDVRWTLGNEPSGRSPPKPQNRELLRALEVELLPCHWYRTADRICSAEFCDEETCHVVHTSLTEISRSRSRSRSTPFYRHKHIVHSFHRPFFLRLQLPFAAEI